MTRFTLVLIALLCTGCPQLASAETVLVEVSAVWCGPCQAMKPTIDKVEAAGVKVYRVDGDKEPSYVARNKITAYPTCIAFDRDKNGVFTESGRLVGKREFDELWALTHPKAKAAK